MSNSTEPYSVAVLEKISPFTFDETKVKKDQRMPKAHENMRPYTVYTLTVTSPLFSDQSFLVEVLKTDYDNMRIAKLTSGTGLINCTAILPLKEGGFVRYSFTAAAEPSK